MICPNCQSDNKEGAKFCNDCGFPLTGRIATVAAASQNAPLRKDRLSSVTSEGAGDSHADAKEAPVELPVVESDEEASDKTDHKTDLGRSDALEALIPEVAPPSAKQNSGSLDPSSLPVIGVAGVDVDEDGNAFDFDEIDSSFEDKGEETETSSQPSEKPETPSSAALTADLSGIDEYLVDSGYTPPAAAWRSGDTMEMPKVEGAAAPKQKEFRAPDPHAKKKGKGRIVAVVAVLLIAAAGIAGGVTYQMELWGGKVIPDVSGMTQADATYALEGKGFVVRAEQSKSDNTEGLVLLMDPSAGARTDLGSEIVIHVAVARTVPDVVGKTQTDAAKLLEKEGYSRVTIATQKSNETEDTVLAISPEPGTKAKATDVITVTVAKPYTVPDIDGLSYTEAVAALEAETYVANLVYSYTEDVAEGYVLGTEPAAGSKLESGATVTVKVSKSRASELVGLAQSYLTNAGSINIGGTSYAIVSVDKVAYLGNNQTSFTITAAAVTVLDGETVRGSSKQKSGTINWDDANQIVSIV